MAMDPLRRVANLWNWLPAFRVVAEYESIQKAAVVLNVSASALSRTVRLLEEATNEPLFVRSANGLALTTFGNELLRGTREAMRRVDDVVAHAQRRTGWDRVLVAAAAGPVLTRLLDRALCLGVREHEGVCYRATSVDETAAAAELLRGNLDVALVESGATFEAPPELTVVHLGNLEFAVLAPTVEANYADADALASTKIVVLEGSAHDQTARVVATVASMDAAEQFAISGGFRAFLPPALAAASFQVVAESNASVGVTAVFRTPLDGEAPALVLDLLASIRTVLAGSRED